MTETWHPILEAEEPTPGRWVLHDWIGREYAAMQLVRRGNQIGYRAEADGAIVGCYRTLRAACFEAHMAHVNASGPQGPANGGKPGHGYPTTTPPEPPQRRQPAAG